MILVVASGSTGSYRIDADGRVHTSRSCLGTPRLPSERVRGFRIVWEPTGQVEALTVEQREELETARLRRDLAIAVAECRAEVLVELDDVIEIAERIAAG